MGEDFIDHTASFTRESFESNCFDGFFVIKRSTEGAGLGRLSLAVCEELALALKTVQ